jgi:membrane-associated protease RseP (regulator of RpoE activity)
MLGTSTTPYDLRFRLLDVPVRVHPFFWLTAALLGWEEGNLPRVIMWIACVFVSILVHEFGHGLMAKYFHGSPSVVLYALGGLCYSQGERTPGQRLGVLFGGPGAGFLLCALVMLIASLLYGITPGEHAEVLLWLSHLTSNRPSAFGHIPSLTPLLIYAFMVQINFFWGLINLLPVWPLDGGQATQVVLTMFDRRHGARRGHIVSLLMAGLIAVFAASREDYFLALMFGILAFMNYQSLQSLHQASSFGLDHDDDWWRG